MSDLDSLEFLAIASAFNNTQCRFCEKIGHIKKFISLTTISIVFLIIKEKLSIITMLVLIIIIEE